MTTNLRMKDTIINGETEDKTYYDIITNGDALGMWTFDQHILKLLKEGLIKEETALAYALRKAIVGRGIDTIKAERGEKTTDIYGLAMDSTYDAEVKN